MTDFPKLRSRTENSLRIAELALQSAEATLAMLAGKLPAHAEQRRTETLLIVRSALDAI